MLSLYAIFNSKLPIMATACILVSCNIALALVVLTAATLLLFCCVERTSSFVSFVVAAINSHEMCST